jgi:NAD(P)-dependent dehydrogenase (short-subunit alcohol dehydrogenase family)
MNSARPAVASYFDLSGRTIVITGGAGLLGLQHAEAIALAGGVPVLLDLAAADPRGRAGELAERCGRDAVGMTVDITSLADVQRACAELIASRRRIDGLINNAANNPKVEAGQKESWTRVENFPLDVWHADISVGLTGAFNCSRVFGAQMATQGAGVILNIASDLALISPDQRLYRKPGLSDDAQPVKPISYSVVKAGLVGMTRYLATYWAPMNVRVNALCPGGMFNGQPPDFVDRLTSLIPLGRMAALGEYRGAVVFMCSDASSYMTGAVISIDGGRTVW